MQKTNEAFAFSIIHYPFPIEKEMLNKLLMLTGNVTAIANTLPFYSLMEAYLNLWKQQ